MKRDEINEMKMKKKKNTTLKTKKKNTLITVYSLAEKPDCQHHMHVGLIFDAFQYLFY